MDAQTEPNPATDKASQDRQKALETKAMERLTQAALDAGIGALPQGWYVLVKQRQSGNSRGDVDYYFYCPDGKRYRSIKEALTALMKPGPGSDTKGPNDSNDPNHQRPAAAKDGDQQVVPAPASAGRKRKQAEQMPQDGSRAKVARASPLVSPPPRAPNSNAAPGDSKPAGAARAMGSGAAVLKRGSSAAAPGLANVLRRPQQLARGQGQPRRPRQPQQPRSRARAQRMDRAVAARDGHVQADHLNDHDVPGDSDDSCDDGALHALAHLALGGRSGGRPSGRGAASLRAAAARGAAGGSAAGASRRGSDSSYRDGLTYQDLGHHQYHHHYPGGNGDVDEDGFPVLARRHRSHRRYADGGMNGVDAGRGAGMMPPGGGISLPLPPPAQEVVEQAGANPAQQAAALLQTAMPHLRLGLHLVHSLRVVGLRGGALDTFSAGMQLVEAAVRCLAAAPAARGAAARAAAAAAPASAAATPPVPEAELSNAAAAAAAAAPSTGAAVDAAAAPEGAAKGAHDAEGPGAEGTAGLNDAEAADGAEGSAGGPSASEEEQHEEGDEAGPAEAMEVDAAAQEAEAAAAAAAAAAEEGAPAAADATAAGVAAAEAADATGVGCADQAPASAAPSPPLPAPVAVKAEQ